MANDVRVLEDGLERDQEGRGRASWVWLVVGFVVGVGVSVVFFQPLAAPSPTTLVTDASPDVPAIPDVSTDAVGITQLVSGFPDALVTVTESNSGSLVYVTWPFAGQATALPLPVPTSSSLKLDESGTWVATSTTVPDTDGFLLSMGKPAGISALVTGVESYAWHDSETGLLAYTRLVDSVWSLWLVGANKAPIQVEVPGVAEGALAAWGKWGWAINHPASDTFTLLNPSGEIRTTVIGTPLASHTDGWLLVYDGRILMVSSGGGVVTVDDAPVPLSAPVAGAISPNREKVAVLGANGLAVYTVGAETPPEFFEIEPRHPVVSWSSDSRFAMVAGARGLTIVDLETGELTEVLTTELVRSVGVVRLAPSS